MTYNELILRLEKIGVSTPDEEAYLILNHLFGVSRAQLLLERDKNYPDEKIETVLQQRQEKAPLQYIFGKWYFMDLELFVSPDCLIPRPDTEILVYEAIKLLKQGGCVCDLCTGSGCIGLSILKARPDIQRMLLADISSGALSIARKNATELSLDNRCEIVRLDITKQMPEGSFDMIVSNPPYIPTSDILSLSDEVKKEPTLALDGGNDGLDIIRALLELSPKALNENGYLLIEFGFDQGEKIAEIMDNLIAKKIYRSYRILKDYGANDRVLLCQK